MEILGVGNIGNKHLCTQTPTNESSNEVHLCAKNKMVHITDQATHVRHMNTIIAIIVSLTTKADPHSISESHDGMHNGTSAQRYTAQYWKNSSLLINIC